MDIATESKPETIELRGRKVVAGRAEGEALVTTETISGWGGINERTGTVIERRHEMRGVSFAGKILVFPGAKGSSGWSAYFHMTRLNGVQPAAMIFTRMTTKIALGAVVTRVPAITELDQDPLSVIETGDWVVVDADAGTVTVTKKSPK
ncbi:aconitase X swivel domain-containing protein [Neorhizobium sp. LjRoot104]|uniref:aconitase X swivel domain-containing protein n=1 Tax=Neorhizobium sp. LjRoot104 TaxID=3342254 RepID=UPI003ECFBC51